jgi:hypothetical protein
MTNVAAAANTTDWITALSTATLGALGLLFTGWQWWASGFRPRLRALLSASGDSIRVQIENRGRGSGLVHHIAVTNKAEIAVGGTFRGFTGEAYSPHTVPAYGRMEITIEAPAGTSYDIESKVIVAWGKDRKSLTVLPVDVSFYGLPPALPPG